MPSIETSSTSTSSTSVAWLASGFSFWGSGLLGVGSLLMAPPKLARCDEWRERYRHCVPETTLESASRRGRPPGTSARELELIALRLFSERGFDHTTVEDIAGAAGGSRRTFFRYFDTKAEVLWHAFDQEVTALRDAFAGIPDDVPLLDAIRRAVVSVNHYTAADVPELRQRINLISSVPALQASAAAHYDAWERAITDFAAGRLCQPLDA